MNRLWNRIVSATVLTVIMFSLVACGTEKKLQKEPEQQAVQEQNQAGQEQNQAEGQQGDAQKQNQADNIEAATTEKAKKDSEEISGSITVLTNRSDLLDTKLAEYKLEFEQKYPETEVVFQTFDNYDKAVSSRLMNGNYGDVLLIPNTISNVELANYFEPFGTMEELQEKYDEKYLQGRQVDGMVYGLPQYVTPQGIAYNKKVFEKAGIVDLPKTPQDFVKALRTIRRTMPETIPYYTGGELYAIVSQWHQHAWGSVSGNADYHYNGMVTDDAPFSKEKPNYIVYRLLYDIVQDGLCEKVEDGINWNMAESLLNQGEIGCMLVEWDRIREIQKAGTNPDDIGYMPFPYNINGIQYATTTIDSYYAISKKSENKATAMAWINYMMRREKFVSSEGAISIGKKGELPTVLKSFEGVELVIDSSPTPDNIGEFERLSKISGLFVDENKSLKRIIEAARTMEEDFDDIMEEWNQRWKDARSGIAYESN